MSNLVLASNVQSPLLSGLVEREQADISYVMEQSYPLMSKQIQLIPARNNPSVPVDSKEVVFDITRMSFLRDLQIQTVFTSGATAIPTTIPIGLTMFSEINLRSANRTLMTASDTYILGRTQCSPIAKCAAIYKRAWPLSQTTGLPLAVTNVKLVCYTPVFNAFCERDPRNFFNLRHYESLQVAARFNTFGKMNIVFGSSFTTCECQLVVSTVDYDDKTYKLLLAKNSPMETPTQFLSYNTIKESKLCEPYVSGANPEKFTTIKVNAQYPISTLYLQLRKAVPVTGDGTMNIKSVSIRVNGVALYETIPKLVMEYEGDQAFGSVGICGDGNTAGTTVRMLPNKVLAIHFGLETSRTFCSGAFATIGTNDVKISILPGEDTAGDDELIYCAEYYQMLSFDNVSSSLQIYSSS